MSKNTNLHDYLSDLADAIREKKGTTEPINAQSFVEEIRTIKSGGMDIPEGYEPFLAADEDYFVQGESDGFKSKYTGEQIDTLLDMIDRPVWTGHADAEGLRAIGWTDEDIAYYQEHGVNWNAEDDEYHKVSEDNKALYGVLTMDNIKNYKDRIVYLPKINTSSATTMYNKFASCSSLVSIPKLDISNVTNTSQMFYQCFSLVSIPLLDTQNVTNMSGMFNGCYSMVSIPQLDTSKVTNMNQMFRGCYSLLSIPQLNTTNVTTMSYMFYECYSLVSIPQLNTINVTNLSNMFYSCGSLVGIPQMNTTNATNMETMFRSCGSLISIPQLDTVNTTNVSNMFIGCNLLSFVNLKNVKVAHDLSTSTKLSKESLLYLINNEAATSAITIKLASYAYTRLANDADIVAALAAHPNVTLAK